MRLGVYTDYTYRRADGRVYAERAFALFLTRLAEEFEQVTIIGKVSPEPGATRYPLAARTGFVELPYYRSLGASREALRAMAGSLSRFWTALGTVDGVWLLGPHPLALAFAVIAALRRKSIALGVRQDFPKYVRARHPLRRWMHHAADLLEGAWRGLGRFVPVVVVGHALAAAYHPERRLEIAVSLVRSEEIASPEVAAQRRYDTGELRVLSVGRLEKEKNPLLLADVIAQLVGRDPRWRLLVCGEGPLERELNDRIERLGVAGHVDLLGYVAHDAGLLELYRKCHVLLHVSWTEGLPQILFEAFAARLPVVATAVGGVPAAVGDAAVLITPGDAEEAAAALERVCADSELRDRIIDAAVTRVTSQTLDAEARRLADFLQAGAQEGRRVTATDGPPRGTPRRSRWLRRRMTASSVEPSPTTQSSKSENV